MHHTFLAAVDAGYHSVKVFTATHQIRIPTSVSRAPHLTATALALEASRQHRYEISGTHYLVGADIRDPIQTRHDEFPMSGASLAVVTDALRQVIPEGGKVRIVTGAPFSNYFGADGQPRNFELNRRINALTRPVRDLSGSPIPRIVSVNVIAQAVAGWFDYALEERGIDAERFSQCTAVIDIGGRTTDVAVMQRGEIDLRASGTKDLGTLELSAAVHRAIDEHIPGISRRSHSFIEEAIRRGVAKVGDREIDIQDLIDREKTYLLDRITDYLAGLHGRFMTDVDTLLWIGGGAALLESALRKRYPRSEFLPDPQMANARGMWKFEIYSNAQDDKPEPDDLEFAQDEFADNHAG